jgi:hypothetical protein
MAENLLVNVFLSGFLGSSGKYRNLKTVLEVLKHGDFFALFKKCFLNSPYARTILLYNPDFL